MITTTDNSDDDGYYLNKQPKGVCCNMNTCVHA